ncbi:MAG: hypothetical protein ABI167_03860, partial [Nitrosospira sp.]
MTPYFKRPGLAILAALFAGFKPAGSGSKPAVKPGRPTLMTSSSLKEHHNRWTRALLLLPILLITSCAMGPDYSRPPIDTAEKFRMTQTEGQSIANLPWWELLHDEALQRLINQALMENRDLRQAVASVE